MQIGEAVQRLPDYFAADGQRCGCCLQPRHPSPLLDAPPPEPPPEPEPPLPALPGEGDGRFVTARHRLLPGPVWASVPRLATLAARAGFDPEANAYRIALPMPAASYRDREPAASYRDREAPVPFARLRPDQRVRIARFWMAELGLPWHDREVDGADAESVPHPGYDQAVQALLLRELALLTIGSDCRAEDGSARVRSRLGAIVDRIRGRIAAFAASPRAAAPFLTSPLAAAHARDVADTTATEPA